LTAVEFYDRTPIENVISSLTTKPEKIIFIVSGNLAKKFEKRYERFAKSHKIEDIKGEFRKVFINNLDNIVEVLSDIAEKEEECFFDLTGGCDLMLVAMGIVKQKYSHKNIQMQRFNVNNGVVTDCDKDGNIIYSGAPELSVSENILIHGGDIRYIDNAKNQSSSEKKGTFKWNFTEQFISDVEKMWNICKKNPGNWNINLNILGEIENILKNHNSLNVSIPVSKVENYLSKEKIKDLEIGDFLSILEGEGLVHSLLIDATDISFAYKDIQVKNCLIKAGTVLEIKVLLSAKKLSDDKSKPYYNDAMNGVYIDWDGIFHERQEPIKDTENEIDVILMKGIVPVFISCKNGAVDDDELYKLETVANRFGGLYAKKVLIATYLGKKSKESKKYFEKRAADMGIRFIDNFHKKTEKEILELIESLA